MGLIGSLDRANWVMIGLIGSLDGANWVVGQVVCVFQSNEDT